MKRSSKYIKEKKLQCSVHELSFIKEQKVSLFMKVYTIKMDYSGYLQGGKVNGRAQYWEGDCLI